MAGTFYNFDVENSEDQILLWDKGGRRTGVNRRTFSYNLHIPERRSHNDRRKGYIRRKKNRIKTI